jgi:hypothetical protein
MSNTAKLILSDAFRVCFDVSCLVSIAKFAPLACLAAFTSADVGVSHIGRIPVYRIPDIHEDLSIQPLGNSANLASRIPTDLVTTAFVGDVPVENIDIIKMDCSFWEHPYLDKSLK